jgi:hypothetical protein
MMKKLIIFAAGALFAAPALAENASTGTMKTDTPASMSADTPATMSPGAGDSAITAEIKIGTDVQDREVVGESATFGPEVEKVVGWTRITGAAQPTQISHVWKRNGEEVSSVPLNVQSASYRTYSRKTVAGLPGNWTFEVKDANGSVIASKDFTVGQTQAPAQTQ